jgi:hypothetical protein
MKKSKKFIVHTVALIWIIFSLVYISYGVWKKQESKVNCQQSYDRGQTDMRNKLIEDTKNCEPTTLYQGDTPFQFVSTSCQNKPSINSGIYKGPTSPPPSK